MKRLINNKIYDIHDAKLVAEFNNGLNATDAKFCVEELYLKKSGDYFLYGRGGIMTQWSKTKREPGEGISPLTNDAAQAWIDQHSHDRHYYADLFGEAEE